MRKWFAHLSPALAALLVAPVLVLAAAAQSPGPTLIGEDVHTPQLPGKDAVRIREFYRLAPQIADDVWLGWSHTIAPLLLVTSETEFLTHHPDPPPDFEKIGDNLYARPRQFSTTLLATFPAFGPQSVIVIGEPENTDAKNQHALARHRNA